MAVWLVRVLDGADPAPVSESRFADVAASEDAAPFVERLAALGVTSGCGDGSLFCPYDSVSRAEMAVFLYRAFGLPDAEESAGFVDVADGHWAAGHIDALAASGITSGCRSEPWSFCPDGSVTKAEMAVFLFRALAWQQQDGAQQRWEYVANPADPNPNNIPDYDPNVFYTEENDLSRYIKEEIVDRYADDNPWLLETWNHTNRPEFIYGINTFKNGVSFLREYADENPEQTLDRRIARKVGITRGKLNDRGEKTLVHELAHVYSLSDGATANPVPVALAHLYFDQLSAGNGLCIGSELYAATAQMLVPAQYNYVSGYWQNCAHLPTRATPEAIEVVENAFAGRIPQWFYDTFEQPDGSLDHETLWTAVKNMLVDSNRIDVIYQLKDAFGGYCSERLAHESASGDMELAQPWRDGGCP